ncbi:MAG: phosphonate ABC transporter ATP-binding protein [Candidatus Bipolaricaulia bacterium]
MSGQDLLRIENLSVTYPSGVRALEDVSLSVREGEFIVIAGVSGAGKSTLLRCINRLVEFTGAELEGQVRFDDQDVLRLSSRRTRRLRAEMGMIFQEFNLVKRSSVMRNVLAGRIPKVGTWKALLGRFRRVDVEVALASLDRVGIKDKAHQRADKLSGGQMQRVGIARALAQEPRLILADEPVASLDPITARVVMEHLKRINVESGITTICNLHDTLLAQAFGDRIVGVRDAQVIFDEPVDKLDEATFEEAIYGAPLSAHEHRQVSQRRQTV